MTAEIIDKESNGRESSSVDFYLPDIKIRDYPVSTKRSFLILMEQVLKTKSQGIEFEINSDGKSHIAIICQGKSLPILTISPGIFDRYWEFLKTALSSSFGLRIEFENNVYELTGSPLQMLSGRKITLHLSNPVKKNDLCGKKE
jgi:hypothetical protein